MFYVNKNICILTSIITWYK